MSIDNEKAGSEKAPILEVRGLEAGTAGKTILKGVDLTMRPGEAHAVMGRNGSGKSTLANVLMGHPAYSVEGGEVLFEGRSILDTNVTERARAGMFLAFQYPMAIPGVTVSRFLRTAIRSARGLDVKPREFRKMLREAFDALGIDDTFRKRYVNDGFSGGEKKRLEVLQMHLLEPKLAILDETDSGLDIDALQTVSDGINRAIAKGTGVLLITHYRRILDHVKPDVVHVFLDGRVARTGGPELAGELEDRGYDWVAEKTAALNAAPAA